ncbi:titin homolog isoform X2 [Mercenaria mercenaria]|uniref:titin homolog isoform X2 n=1 Tax=Mercenaria mercenaria TaxID=6596 RepID=UPI00234EB90E|nr:titin homolog isoform X2 [Mercenaria mercenaria]
MDKYLKIEPASLEEMLAACKDFKERQNIRCALREIKGLKLEGTDIITYSFGSKSVKRLSSDTSPRKHQLPLKPSAIDNKTYNIKDFDVNNNGDSKSQGVKSIKVHNNTDENENEKPQFRSYLYAGTLSSPKNSLRGKKDFQSPRKVHTTITRINVLDKSELVDKCTETEEGVIDTKARTEIPICGIESQKIDKHKSFEKKEKIKRYESTPLPKNERKEDDSAVLDISAIEFSGELEKVKQISVLHRPVSVSSSSLNSDNTHSPRTQISPVISSPRKPRKIVSYRTSAFTPATRLNPVSSTITRTKLQSAPPTVDKSSENSVINNSQERTKEVKSVTIDTSQELKDIQGLLEDCNDTFVGRSVESKVLQNKNSGTIKQDSAESVDTQEGIYTAKAAEIKRDSSGENLVSRLKSKLESKRKRDFKSEIQEFSYFTNKMKEKHGKENNTEDKFIVLSPVKTDPDDQVGVNELNSDVNVISNYTNNKTMTMEDNVDDVFFKKKIALSRKNRIDSDEQKHYRKYRKKKTDSVKIPEDPYLHDVVNKGLNPNEQKRHLTEMSPRKVSKTGSVRRKLPEIPVKRDIEMEDDETVHQRTIRLLQERKKERREKLTNEKEIVDKVDKSKMNPADLKKTLEQKLERSDSKRKAYRVRRELQLLNRENELKSGYKSDDDTFSSSDKTDNEINGILTSKVADKYRKEPERILVQRSKSDIVRRRRAVSETDVLVNEPMKDTDGEERERNVLKMFETEEPLTPIGKIELIGSLMQEEAKLQEMLRKSANFSEKRKMRAEVRQLRQKRMALEGTTDVPPVSALRRSASVTAGVITHATPVFIVAPERKGEKKPDEDTSPSSIEELRKKLSETEDYDEKKKIRLALRQLRQQNREGAQSGLKRSQSFIHQRSSEPIVNGTAESNQTVLRSCSVAEKRDAHIDRQIKEKNHETETNRDYSHAKKETLKQSEARTDKSKPTVQRHSSFNSDRWNETEKKSEETKNSKNLHETVFQSNSVNGSASINGSPLKELNTDKKNESNDRLRHSQCDSVRRKSGDKDKICDVPNDKHDNSGVTLIRKSGKETEKTLTQSEIPKSVTDVKKPVEFLKDTVIKLENQKKNRIFEKCEIFEKAGRKESDRKVKEHDIDNEHAKSKASHILVSRADVERNKQNKLVNLRRDRSNSEPQIWSVHSDTSSAKEGKQGSSKNIDKTDTDRSCKTHAVTKDIDKRLKRDLQSNIKGQDRKFGKSEKQLNTTHEKDSRLSPSLLWLEEKRKSLPLSKDIDKLMSTMDIEAAFSEILGAVEEFPEQNDMTDISSADVPILEEDSCESSEMEEDLKKHTSNDINGEKVQNEPKMDVSVKKDTESNEIIDTAEIKLKNVIEASENGSSAIQQNSGIKKSEAKIELSNNLSLDVKVKPEDNGAISVIHGDDGTVTVQEVSQVQEGDTTITEWKKLRRTQSRTETRETDTVVEKKITSPGGSSSVYEKDVSKTKHKLTSRGSNYFTRNHYNIKRKKDLDGTELVEHDLSSVTENMSVSKNETWGDKSEAKVVLNRDPADGSPLKLKSIQDVLYDTDVTEKSDVKEGDSSVCQETTTSHIAAVHKRLGRPSGCPEVKATLKETTATEGDTTVLECTVISSPLPAVSWFRGDNLLSNEKDGVKMDFDPDTGKASLTIHPVSLKDAGQYKCMFENQLGTASTNGRLIIKKTTSGLPSFFTKLADVTVCEGHSLCLECQVSDTDTVLWYKDGAILRSNSDFKQTFDGTEAKLEITEIFLDDCGTYSCAVKSSNGEERCSCKVTVEESESPDVVYPVFLKKPETTIANERDPVIIDCEVIGSPEVNITWYRDGSKVTEDGRHRMSFDGRVAMLVIRKVTVGDSGKIECLAENSSGKVSAHCHLVVKALKSAPSLTQPLSDVTVISGKKASLTCIINGEPKPEITWRKNGLIIGQMFDFKQTYNNHVAELEISETCARDTGCYECIAANEKGEISTSCQLTVHDENVQVERSITPEVEPQKVTAEKSFTAEVGKQKVTAEKSFTPEVEKQKVTAEKSFTPEVGKQKVTAEKSFTPEMGKQKVTADKSFTPEVEKQKVTAEKSFTPEMGKQKETAEKSFTPEVGKQKVTAEKSFTPEVEKQKVTAEKSFTPEVEKQKVTAEKSFTPEVEKQKVTVQKETIQTAAVKNFTVKFEPSMEGEHKQVAKSQASKVMLVRQGSLRSLRRENSEKSLVRTGSLQSIDTSIKAEESKRSIDLEKPDKYSNAEDNRLLTNGHSTESQNKSSVKAFHTSKGKVDINKNYGGKHNANLPEPDEDKNGSEIKNYPKNNEEILKTVKAGSNLSSLCLESSNVKEVKPVAKFRTGGEIRRSQSVRSSGSEKPEWLQVKLRKVGSKPSPLAAEREKSKTQSQDSSNKETIVTSELPVSVQRETKLSRSQSARIVDRNTSLALRDSTNSPSNQPNRDSVKLTPVSERAKIFQMRDTNSSSSSSGKSSPVDIIAKAINLSRTESLRSPVGNRSLGIQRSHSFKIEAPSSSQGDVTLELTPQKEQKQEDKSDSGSTRKEVKYWDPSAPSSTKMDYSTITDEEQLNQLLSKSDNFDERKKIRARIKELREQHMKEWEAKRAGRPEPEDAIKRKHREADLMKQQKLQQFQKQAAQTHESKHLDLAEQQLRDRLKLAEEEKKRTLKELSGAGATHHDSPHLAISERALQEKIKQADILKKKTLDSYDQAAGKTGMSQTSTVKTEISRDGKSVTTTRKVETVTKVGGATGKPAEDIAPQLAQQIIKAAGNVSGVLTVKTESWSSKDNVTHTSEKTESWGGRGGAMNAFKAMDAKNAPKTNLAPGAGRGANITRSPSAIKTMLLEWCKAMTREYTDIIEITNFSTSWNNGLAFCALIHHFYPEAFDIRSLDAKQRRKNFELAFDTAEKLADIAPLLDVEDMVRMQKPDWKCVFTYVQSFYRKLNAHERNKAAA